MPSSACKTCALDRKSTRLNSSHTLISYAVFCLKQKRVRSEEHTSELQSHSHLVCRLLLAIKVSEVGIVSLRRRHQARAPPALAWQRSAIAGLSIVFFYRRGAPASLDLSPPQLFPEP